MTQFDESKHRRDGEGKFASKGPSAEAAGVELSPDHEPKTQGEIAEAMAQDLVSRGIRDDSIGRSYRGAVTIHDTYSPQRNSPNPFGSRYSTFVSVEPEDSSSKTFRMVSGWQDYEADTGAYDGDEEVIESGLSQQEAVDRLYDYVVDANDASEYGEHYDVRVPEPLPDDWKPMPDPWVNAQLEEPPF